MVEKKTYMGCMDFDTFRLTHLLQIKKLFYVTNSLDSCLQPVLICLHLLDSNFGIDFLFIKIYWFQNNCKCNKTIKFVLISTEQWSCFTLIVYLRRTSSGNNDIYLPTIDKEAFEYFYTERWPRF